MRPCIFVLGTRAQLVKVAPVLREAVDAGLDHVVWFTGQHNESIDDLITDFDVRSRFVLPESRQERSSIMKLLVWLPGTFFRCRRYIRNATIYTDEAPLVIVHGDTLSTWLGALAARFAGGRVVHLESGLTSGKLTDPFPEEILRRLTFKLTDYALCPNDAATARMRAEGKPEVVHTGENTILDCVRYATRDRQAFNEDKGYFIASIHRFQNIYHRATLQAIVDELLALSTLGEVLFILHPPTEQRLRKYGLYETLDASPSVTLRSRMPYTDFLGLMSGARAVLSDGGSNQEELSYLGVPTILFRERSERPDGLGENIVLRSEVRCSLAEFAGTRALDALRRESRIFDAVQPSKTSVEALLRWAS